MRALLFSLFQLLALVVLQQLRTDIEIREYSPLVLVTCCSVQLLLLQKSGVVQHCKKTLTYTGVRTAKRCTAQTALQGVSNQLSIGGGIPGARCDSLFLCVFAPVDSRTCFYAPCSVSLSAAECFPIVSLAAARWSSICLPGCV